MYDLGMGEAESFILSYLVQPLVALPIQSK